ncbi:ABC transporter permease [Actomonas aquatica]|uniref:ABC transporter permease n=1 Tax=Actomonas aquatica TaxID=2866162 RepID=A0ABZ1C4K3_9BACT|nr:ABC transporter permease [Opitutus sp. WL0086]WRQ86652.1 ABC transporter permease [Opitutus sp. WL0086]
MLQDLRFALRMLTKHRWFSAAIIATLALGIGINSTVFTLVNAVLFKPVPVAGGDRLVTVLLQNTEDPSQRRAVSWPEFQELRAANHTFEALEAINDVRAVISETDLPPERTNFAWVSSGLFATIGQPPLLGRSFNAADSAAGAEIVLMLSHDLWQNRYGGDRAVIGRTVRLDGHPATIVGVMPPGFRFPNQEELWAPLRPTPAIDKRDNRSLMLYGVRQPGVSIAEANADLNVIMGRLATEFPDTNKNLGAVVRSFHETYNGGPIKVIFLMMLGAVGFVLLIACANVANMMLARAISRGREIAVRAAVGASRRQLIRQLLIESVLLSVIGGLLGFAFTGLGVSLFDEATTNVGRPYWIQFELDWVAVGYFAAITIASGIIFGLAPALRSSRVDLSTAIKDGSPGAGSGRNRLSGALVIMQFALTVVLLAGAGAMIRSLFLAQELNAFVQPDTLLTARVQLPERESERYEQPDARRQFVDTLLPQLRALPGVTAAAVTNAFPGMDHHQRVIEIEGRPQPADATAKLEGTIVVASPDYLRVINLPLLRGREFNETDGQPGSEATVITQSFAQRHWPDADPIGQRFRFIEPQDNEPQPWMTVVGVSGDLEQNPTNADAPPAFFISYRQQPWGWAGLIVRTHTDPAALALPVRSTVQAIDADLPLFQVQPFVVGLDRSIWFLRVFGTVFSVFAATGLLMAAVGIYGVIAHQTARRTREIGIRMALGATTTNIARLVLGRGLGQLAIGLIVGLAGAFGATKLLASAGVLIGTGATDPVLFGAVTSVLVLVGLSACWLPARRATKVAPTEALRTE